MIDVPPELRVYTIPEVAGILKIERKKVERLIKAGSLPAKLIGNSFRIRHADLQAFLENPDAASTVGMTREARERR